VKGGIVHNILIVDDDVAVTNYLMVFLMQNEIFEPTVVNDSREVPDLLQQTTFDTIILDMDMPNLSGLDLLKIIHERGIDTPVIVLSGVNDVELAVKALKLDAFDYLTKPVDDEYLLEMIDKAIKHRTVHDTISQLPEELSRGDLAHEEAFENLVTQDPDMIHLFHEVEKIAGGDASILLIGERGTGKSTLAKASHNVSERRGKPFVIVNVADHAPESFAADFFGRAKGWRGAEEEREGYLDQADTGTLYLSNIERLTPPMQHRLDRLIRSGEFYREGTTTKRNVDIRLIASSTSDFSYEGKNSAFSKDLLYNLVANSIHLIPLRDRVDDIPLLADYFMKREAKRTKVHFEGIESNLIEILKGYSFPGNQDELRDIIVNAVHTEKGETLSIEALSHYLRDKIVGGLSPDFRLRPLKHVISEHVSLTLEYFKGNHNEAAKALGVTLPKLHELLP